MSDGTSTIETIRYWIAAYTDPASGPHFQGHGAVVQLMREYLATRAALPEERTYSYRDMIAYGRLCWAVSRAAAPSETEPLPKVGTAEEMDATRAALAPPPAAAEARDADSEKYRELLFAVSSKHPGETRHQTALRYIVERERAATEGAALAAHQKGGGE